MLATLLLGMDGMSERNADEIEITPEMIVALETAYRDWRAEYALLASFLSFMVSSRDDTQAPTGRLSPVSGHAKA
jgi:hypothetical protein